MNVRQALTRSLAEEGVYPRAVPMQAATYDAYQVAGSRTYPVKGLDASTLEEAMTRAVSLQLFSHKDHLAIRETSDRGSKLHLFAVKKRSTPRYVHRDHVTRRVNDLYLAPICTIDESVL